MSELDRLVERFDRALQAFGEDRAWSLNRVEMDVGDVREWRWCVDLNGLAGIGRIDGKTPEEAFRKATDGLVSDAQFGAKRREEQAKGARDRLAALLRAIEQP